MRKPSLQKRFDKFEDDSQNFHEVPNPLPRRSDIAAFLLLDQLVPSDDGACILGSAEHDLVYLEVDPKALNRAATDDNIRDLIRCGVGYDPEIERLFMYV